MHCRPLFRGSLRSLFDLYLTSNQRGGPHRLIARISFVSSGVLSYVLKKYLCLDQLVFFLLLFYHRIIRFDSIMDGQPLPNRDNVRYEGELNPRNRIPQQMQNTQQQIHTTPPPFDRMTAADTQNARDGPFAEQGLAGYYGQRRMAQQGQQGFASQPSVAQGNGRESWNSWHNTSDYQRPVSTGDIGDTRQGLPHGENGVGSLEPGLSSPIVSSQPRTVQNISSSAHMPSTMPGTIERGNLRRSNQRLLSNNTSPVLTPPTNSPTARSCFPPLPSQSHVDQTRGSGAVMTPNRSAGATQRPIQQSVHYGSGQEDASEKELLSQIISLLKEIKDDRKQMHVVLREEISKIGVSIVAAVKENTNEPTTLKRKSGGLSDDERKVVIMFELAKYLTCMELLNSDKGVSIFQRKPLGTSFGSITMDASRAILGNPTDVEQAQFLQMKVHIGSNDTSACTFVDRGVSRVHDVIRNRFINAFLSSLPSENPLSLSSRCENIAKKDFANRLLTSGDHYTDDVYGSAWKNACHTAAEEVKNVAVTSKTKVMEFNREFSFPSLSSSSSSTNNEQKLSIYFLAFVILKVCYRIIRAEVFPF